MHGDLGNLLNNQQTASYNQQQHHQWNQQPADLVMTNQTYLTSPTNHSNFQQPLIIMQQSQVQSPEIVINASNNIQQPQIGEMGGNNYIGQSLPKMAPINNDENDSTSEESDDNANHDSEVSYLI